MKDTYSMYDALDNICFKEVDSMGNHGVSERGVMSWWVKRGDYANHH